MADENELAARVAELEASNAKLSAKADELLDEVKAERQKRRDAEAAKAEADEIAQAKAEEAASRSGDVDSIKASLEAKHTAALKRVQDEANDYRGQLHRLVIDGGIRDALASADVAPSLSKAAGLLFKDGRNIEVKDGQAFVDGVPIAEAVTEWASADGAAFKAAGHGNGGGAPGGGKSGGVRLSDMSEGERMKLASENPARFRELRSAET